MKTAILALVLVVVTGSTESTLAQFGPLPAQPIQLPLFRINKLVPVEQELLTTIFQWGCEVTVKMELQDNSVATLPPLTVYRITARKGQLEWSAQDENLNDSIVSLVRQMLGYFLERVPSHTADSRPPSRSHR